jgi:hypothetical protein
MITKYPRWTLKNQKEVKANSLQNPSDTEASFEAHKEKEYQAQLVAKSLQAKMDYHLSLAKIGSPLFRSYTIVRYTRPFPTASSRMAILLEMLEIFLGDSSFQDSLWE